MTKFKITRDMGMCKSFEQPPESASPFLEVPKDLKGATRKRFAVS
jgi:hypothetical protein